MFTLFFVTAITGVVIVTLIRMLTRWEKNFLYNHSHLAPEPEPTDLCEMDVSTFIWYILAILFGPIVTVLGLIVLIFGAVYMCNEYGILDSFYRKKINLCGLIPTIEFKKRNEDL